MDSKSNHIEKPTFPEMKPLQIKALNFSFSFTFWLSLNLLFFLAGLFFIGVVLSHVEKSLEMLFQDQGKILAQNLKALFPSYTPAKKNDFIRASEIFQKAKGDGRIIEEILILDKVGRVLAHSDFLQISPKSKKLADEIHPRYHKEFFHSALNLREGEVKVQDFPEGGPFLIQSLFLKFFEPFQKVSQAYFSTPLSYKNQAYATLHILIKRQKSEEALIWLEKKAIIFFGIFLLVGNLFYAIFLLAFGMRAHFMEKLWQNHWAYFVENSYLRQELQKTLIESKLRLEGVEPKKRILPEPKLTKEPVDAILLEE